MPACCFASAGRWECIVRQTGAEAILGFTRQNRDAHASFRIRGMGYCRIPSLQGTRGVKTVETTEQWCCLLGGPTSWLRTPYSSNDWPVRLFPRPPFPLPPVCELLFRGVSSPACPLRSRCTPQPPEIPSRPFHPIYARETVWSGKRKDPPPSFPSPGFSVVKSMRPPSLRTTRCAEGAESQCRLPTLGAIHTLHDVIIRKGLILPSGPFST